MRWRIGAAVVLCGSLVAGCGTATRLDSSGQSRPATPVNVSVYLGGGRARVEPGKVRRGLALFNVTNQTASSETVSIVIPDGRTVARGVRVAAGGTGQLKAMLSLTAYGVELDGRPSSMTLVTVRGPARSGNDQLQQP